MTNNITATAEFYRITGDSRELVVDAWKRLANVRLALSARALSNPGNFSLSELVLDVHATLDVIDEARQVADSDDDNLSQHDVVTQMSKYLRQARIMVGCLRNEGYMGDAARAAGDNLGAIHELLRDAAGPVRVLKEQLDAEARALKAIAPTNKVTCAHCPTDITATVKHGHPTLCGYCFAEQSAAFG